MKTSIGMFGLSGFAAVLFAAPALAAVNMAQKAPVVKTVESVNSGKVEITSEDLKGWRLDAVCSLDDGRDVVTVTLTSPVEAEPPQFGVFYRVSGAEVQSVWIADMMNGDGCHLRPQLWWSWCTKYTSQLARNSPIAVGFNPNEISPVAIACSEAMEYLEFGLYADDETADIIGRCEFFRQKVAPRKNYTVKVLLDRRGRGFAETVRDLTAWVMKENDFTPAYAPEAAFDPLYSTWYAYLQDVHDGELETEAKLAASLGMKTMILDDGWQKEESASFYSAVGDWQPVKGRFPDMKAHVAKVHAAGLKYMPWLSMPFVGDESKAWNRFQGKFLRVNGEKSPGKVGNLDPRFPEVREYLISTYERMLRRYGFDGLKLDFIDSFTLPDDKPDPAIAENYAGRDFKSVPEAVNRLMLDVHDRLVKINPDVLLEFRQAYMGPAILQYGNMMRAADVPEDHRENRRRICDLRLTSAGIAVHSDMLVWSKDETPEGAAMPILDVLFSTIQYSMILKKINPAHKEVIRHWLKFSQDHREALLKGEFTPHHPELAYPWVEGESVKERIVAGYAPSVVVKTGAADKPVYLVNGTGAASMVVESTSDGTAEFFDVLGKACGTAAFKAGLNRLAIPKSGYAKVTW